jgi:hypothetical protein
VDEEFDIEYDFRINRKAFLSKLIIEKKKENEDESSDDGSDIKAATDDQKDKKKDHKEHNKPKPKKEPKSVKRVSWIFDCPVFVRDGFANSATNQGSLGDCWFVSALVTMTAVKGLVERICVCRDEAVGVYGFAFHRDGTWIPTVVDDFLYLEHADYSGNFDPDGSRAKEYRERWQTGSKRLFFGNCEDQNETWFPLLEKAYAKIHGDYPSLSAGWIGEAVEDMAGGISTQILTNSTLDKDILWKEITEEPKKHVFSVQTYTYRHEDYKQHGLQELHAYSIMNAAEETGEDGKNVRFVKLR